MTPPRSVGDAPTGEGRAAATAAFRVCGIWSMDALAQVGRVRIGRMRVSQSWEDAG